MMVEVLDTRSKLDHSAALWEALRHSTGRHEIFLRHGWVAAWFEHLADGCAPFILTASVAGAYVAILPLALRHETWHRLPVRTLIFPAGLSSGNIRGDLLARQEYEDAAAHNFIRHLQLLHGAWQRWDLTGLTADSSGCRALQRALIEVGWRHTNWRADTELYFLPVEGAWEDYLQRRGRSFRKNLRMAHNRLLQLPGMAFRSLQTEAEIEQGVRLLLELDGRCTKAEREGVVRLLGPVGDFYSKVINEFAREGKARIDLVLQGDLPIASLVTFLSGGTAVFYYNAYMSEYAHCAPGRLLFERTASALWRDGLSEIDFNGRTRFVRHWSDCCRSIVSATVYAPGVLGRLAWWNREALEPIRQAAWRRGWCPITPTPRAGVRAAAIERPLPAALQAAPVSLFASGRAALDAGLPALPLQAGDEIAFPAYHCGTELDAVLAAGLKPRFYSVDRDMRIEPEAIAAVITERTRAVYVIHYLGWPQAVTPLVELCKKHALLLIEDCAQALYSAECENELEDSPAAPLGRHSAMAIFSLHKFLPLIDGGALRWNLASKSPQGVALLQGDRYARLRGLFTARSREYSGWRAWLALLGNLSDTLFRRLPLRHARMPLAMHSASMALLKCLPHDAIIAQRRANNVRLHGLFARYAGFELPFPPTAPGFVPLLFAVLADNAEPLVAALNANGIEAGLHWPSFDSRFPLSHFHAVAFLKAHLVVLPVHQEMREQDFAVIEQVLYDLRLPLAKEHVAVAA